MKLDIEALAREAGLTSFKNICDGEWRGPKGSLAAYTNAVLEAARQVCDARAGMRAPAFESPLEEAKWLDRRAADAACAEAIRALKVTP